jgi:hypothetical protein
VINCHLVHSAKNFAKRNAMMSQLVSSFKFGKTDLDPDVYSDVAIIIGDLNYRMAGTYESNMN